MPLHGNHAQVIASSTKARPVWEGISPRWICKLIPRVIVGAGLYRINQVTTPTEIIAEHPEDTKLPDAFADYEANPSEVTLSAIQTVVAMQTRIQDIFSSPHDQLKEQIRLAAESLKEERERRMITSASCGLLALAVEKMRLQASGGRPTPDDLDNLLSLVWKKPSFFLAHPLTIAAFCREANAQRLTVEVVHMMGVPFVAWRGVPLVPSDKVPVGKSGGKHDTSSILLMRVGEQEQGVITLCQRGIGDQNTPFNIRFMGIDQHTVARYLLTCYFSIVALSPDALAVLHNVRADRA